MAKKTELAAGRRDLVRDEVAFDTRRRKCGRRHTWQNWTVAPGETVKACGVCGHIAVGETMPAGVAAKARRAR
jgi:hypothetical protein